MKFAGMVKNSFVDFPGQISTVVFTSGCNFNCWYCHNRDLIPSSEGKIDESEVFEFLKSRKGFIDGVVISGGEPTLSSGLYEFIKKVKSFGLKVKLDTNGTNPKILEKLLGENLLDYVAMDIKTSFENYEKIVGKGNFNKELIQRSINILKTGNVDYEFRTTFAPDVSLSDIEQISMIIEGARAYAIQKYNAPNLNVIKIPHSKEDFIQAKEIARKRINNVFLRSID